MEFGVGIRIEAGVTRVRQNAFAPIEFGNRKQSAGTCRALVRVVALDCRVEKGGTAGTDSRCFDVGGAH